MEAVGGNNEMDHIRAVSQIVETAPRTKAPSVLRGVEIAVRASGASVAAGNVLTIGKLLNEVRDIIDDGHAKSIPGDGFSRAVPAMGGKIPLDKWKKSGLALDSIACGGHFFHISEQGAISLLPAAIGSPTLENRGGRIGKELTIEIGIIIKTAQADKLRAGEILKLFSKRIIHCPGDEMTPEQRRDAGLALNAAAAHREIRSSKILSEITAFAPAGRVDIRRKRRHKQDDCPEDNPRR